MTKTEFLQILREELDGRVPYSVIQENLNYYNSYIDGETAKGRPELQVIEELGGPRIIARTIVDATLDTEDRPDGFQSYGGSEEYDGASKRTAQKQWTEYGDGQKRSVHYVDFSKWYVRLLAGLAGFVVIFLLITLLLGIMGLAGWILSVIWPVLLILLVIWYMKGPRR